jgi:hypothetical protein
MSWCLEQVKNSDKVIVAIPMNLSFSIRLWAKFAFQKI